MPDVLILGSGLAGSAAAITLAHAGREVTLVEREAGPSHKVCGEFLSAEALASLQQLGINAAGLGAVPITTVRFAGRGSRATTAALPFAAMSLTRKRLDEALLKEAERAGATVVRGVTARALDCTDRWRAQFDDGSTRHAPAVFLATGKHDLRGRLRPPGTQPNLTGFKMYWRLAPAQRDALGNHVELLAYRGGYAGLQPVEDDVVNLCCLLDRKTLRECKADWQRILDHMQTDCPHLARRLQGATPLLGKPLAISSIPYGFVRTRTEPGLWALGDQAAVIPSFTGDGMSIALHSGMVAAAMYLAGATADDYQGRLQRTVRSQVAFATMLSRAMISPPGRRAAGPILALWPGALRAIATHTRLRDAR